MSLFTLHILASADTGKRAGDTETENANTYQPVLAAMKTRNVPSRDRTSAHTGTQLSVLHHNIHPSDPSQTRKPRSPHPTLKQANKPPWV